MSVKIYIAQNGISIIFRDVVETMNKYLTHFANKAFPYSYP